MAVQVLTHKYLRFKSEKLVSGREMHHDDSWLRVDAALFQKPGVLGYEFAKLARWLMPNV